MRLSQPNTRQRIRRIWLGLFFSGVFLLWWSEFSTPGKRLDFWICRQFYGVDSFSLRNSTIFEFWWHQLPKNLMYLLPAWALLQLIYALRLQRRKTITATQLEESKRWLALLLLGALIPTLLAELKKLTNQACPWSLTAFGGTLPYVHLFDARPWAAHSQACWPAGHAGTGLALFAVAFVGGLPRALWSPKLGIPRRFWLSGRAFAIYALALSMALGFSQVMRGAHFISHQIWSLWITLVFSMLCTHLGLIKTHWWRLDE